MFTVIYNNTGKVENIVAEQSNREHLLQTGKDCIYVDKLPKYDFYRQGLKVVGKELKVIDYEITPEREKFIQQIERNSRIAELKQLLASTDYQAIKHFEGCLTDYEYEPIKTQRQAWRDEINELEKLI